ncbi:MAG TPA: FG-GAP repeat protein [Actinomycetota bacterium]|jgi:hypothetical protein|nr:FG-GAP repeat protein [Actinomycetota bacterium]
MRWRKLALLLLMILLGGLVRAFPAEAVVSDGPCSSTASGDFNGDGFGDLAVGVPDEDVGSVPDGGAVHVIYGSASGLDAANNQLWTQNTEGVNGATETSDRFGACIAVGNFNGDTNAGKRIDDLAIGVPGEDLDGVVNAGAVNVIYGSKSGDGRLSTTQISDQIWSQNYEGVEDVAESGDVFGNALAAGDFNGDGKDDLAIGAPLENLGSLGDAGLVHVVYGTEAGLHPTGDQIWHQNSSGVEGVAEGGDRFGSALTAGFFNNDAREDLAIGVAGENIGSVVDAGAVNVLYGASPRITSSGDQVFSQNTTGVTDDAEANDFFGRSLAAGDFGGTAQDDLAIGVPGEDLTSPTRADAGAVQIIPGAAGGLVAASDPLITQDAILSTPDTSEATDGFGSSLAAANVGESGLFDLAIGTPFEDDGASNAGAVDVLYGTATGLNLSAGAPAADFLQQGVGGIDDSREADDAFGASLTPGNFDGGSTPFDLAIGAPLEETGVPLNSGAVVVVYGAANGLDAAGPPADQLWQQGGTILDALEAEDMFGSAA